METIHYYGRAAERHDSPSVIKGTIPVKTICDMYDARDRDEDEYDEVVNEHDDGEVIFALLEDVSREEFDMIVMKGVPSHAVAEEIWFGIGNTLEKAKVGFCDVE